MTGVLNALLGFKTGAIVTLSGEVILHGAPSATAGVRINTDGTIDKREGGSGYSQIDSATDWLRPAAMAPGLYEVMAHVESGTLHASSDAEDTWLPMSGGPYEWFVATASGTVFADVTLSVRYGSGAALDSGLYELEADAT